MVDWVLQGHELYYHKPNFDIYFQNKVTTLDVKIMNEADQELQI